MVNQHQSKGQNSPEGATIFVYGFDKLEFEIPSEPVKLSKIGRVEFIKFKDDTSLDKADGVIIPQGVFEDIRRRSGAYVYTDVDVDWDLLFARERQVHNLRKAGKWVCFVIGRIVDSVVQQYEREYIEETDLCKRLLNDCGVTRVTVDGWTGLDAKDNAFAKYVREFGVANTVLHLGWSRDAESRVLVKAGDRVVGVEFDNQLFFLPFHTTGRDKETASRIAVTVAQAVSDYRQKRTREIPMWADEFQFKAERKLQAELAPAREQVDELQAQLEVWRAYKAILSTSGDILKDELVKILREYFELRVDPIEEYREDAKVLDESGNVLALVECKGVKRGIQRQDINQVDTHREMNKMDASVPGVLLINNQMSVAGIDKRLETPVPDDQIERAKNNNVLIIRTIDLLFLMRHLEESSARKEEFMELVRSGGGWLRTDTEGYTVVQEGAPKPE